MPTNPPFPIALGQRTLAAIVFTDVVGYSARMHKEEEGTITLLEQDFSTMKEFSDGLSGVVLKSTGDGLLIYFSSAVNAVTWAVKIQRHFAERSRTELLTKILRHRVGVHVGDVFRTEEDVVGDGVNIAARVQTEAPTGGVCISQAAYDMVKNKMELHVARLSSRQLKNIAEPVPMYHVLLDGPEVTLRTPAAMPAQTEKAGRDLAAGKRRFWAVAATLVAIGGAGFALYRFYFGHEAQLEASRAAQAAFSHAVVEQKAALAAARASAEKETRAEPTPAGEIDFVALTTRRPAEAGANPAALAEANACLPALDAWVKTRLASYTANHALLVRDLDATMQEAMAYSDEPGKISFGQRGLMRKSDWAALSTERQSAIIVSLLRDASPPAPRAVSRGAEAFAYLHGLPEMAAGVIRLRAAR